MSQNVFIFFLELMEDREMVSLDQNRFSLIWIVYSDECINILNGNSNWIQDNVKIL